MGHIAWDNIYNIGVDFIDKEHQVLFSTMNKLMSLSEREEKSEHVCREGIKYLKSHTDKHFEHEEEYMQSINYSDYEIHKRLHDDFRYKTVPALAEEMEDSSYSPDSIRHFLGVCVGWVISHTLTEDQAIVGKTGTKWGDIPHEKEKDALEATIIQLVQEMFQLKARLISEQYAGEDFGKVFCCRMVYSGEKKEQWQITLVFEDRILLNTVSNILNTEYPKVDDMVLNVTRYLSRQFLEQIRERIPAFDLLTLEDESLLTHEQLLKMFEREQPSCSLLFSTEAGYFAFSAVSAESISGKIVPGINHQNAMNAVREYLVKENEEQEKRRHKILVVDDSEFILGRMRQLLSGKYDILESDSSISAIRMIALNRPDLVLLDYEMPICDGKQALEMIRSDKAIADIPVMFLTGRSDKESVKNVKALKPEGYLLKTMPDDFIKKTVEDFFKHKK